VKVSAYLADTGHLSTVEHGAYMMLIMHYWRTEGLPDDDQKLANITRLPLNVWLEIRPTIRAFFFDGWKHKRIEWEMTEAARLSSAGKKGGEASGEARRGKKEKAERAKGADKTNDFSTLNDRSTTDERSFNDRSTIDERSSNDSPTIREAPHSQSQSHIEETNTHTRARG
jgi:uncharacterized protein YdaU (DUF1376 family)